MLSSDLTDVRIPSRNLTDVTLVSEDAGYRLDLTMKALIITMT